MLERLLSLVLVFSTAAVIRLEKDWYVVVCCSVSICMFPLVLLSSADAVVELDEYWYLVICSCVGVSMLPSELVCMIFVVGYIASFTNFCRPFEDVCSPSI